MVYAESASVIKDDERRHFADLPWYRVRAAMSDEWGVNR